MQGSAFIIHNDTWSCSNEVVLGIYSEPIFGEGNTIASIKETKTLTVTSIFNATDQPKAGDRCDIVLLSDKKYGLVGEFKTVGHIKTIINILGKTERISEILRKIEIKN